MVYSRHFYSSDVWRTSLVYSWHFNLSGPERMSLVYQFDLSGVWLMLLVYPRHWDLTVTMSLVYSPTLCFFMSVATDSAMRFVRCVTNVVGLLQASRFVRCVENVAGLLRTPQFDRSVANVVSFLQAHRFVGRVLGERPTQRNMVRSQIQRCHSHILIFLNLRVSMLFGHTNSGSYPNPT